MTSKAASVLGLVGVAAALAASAAVLHAGDRHRAAVTPAGRDLYLRSGDVARRFFLSFDSLAADVYWVRTIQHYGRDRRSARVADRFELLFPLLDLTTSLDPYFTIAYRFGAVFLAERPPSGPGRADQAIALLQKGLRATPNRWQYAFDIGFIHYWHGTASGEKADYAAAAAWFDRAASMPNAPVWIRPLAATTRAAGGDRAGARRLLEELAGSEEAWIRRAATRGLEQLAAAETIGRLQQRLEAFEAAHGRPPASWHDLDPAVPPNAVPLDPSGAPYEYDREAHRIQLSPASPLAPLPRSLSVR